MTTYREFQAELERLHQQSESARRRQKAEAFTRIRALIDEYQLEPSSLGLSEWKWTAKQDPSRKIGARSKRAAARPDQSPFVGRLAEH